MKILNEFKAFISRGNVIDLAVGVIIGGAFTAIVNSLVNDIFMPLISMLTGGIDFSSWVFVMGVGETAATVKYGSFISAVINFLLVAIVIFLLIKAINKMHAKKAEAPVVAPRTCPFCLETVADEATRCPHCTSELPEKTVVSKS
ncbi:MAG: large conductance mechanosensitive channel protein MscL [Oscillospiraceae bacterium]